MAKKKTVKITKTKGKGKSKLKVWEDFAKDSDPSDDSDQPEISENKPKEESPKPKVENRKPEASSIRKNLTLKNKSKEKKRKRSKRRKWINRSIIFLAFLLSFLGVSAYFYIITPILNIRESVYEIESIAIETTSDLEDKDISNLDENIGRINREIESINNEIDGLAFLKSTSLTKGYYENLQIVSGIAEDSNELIKRSVPRLKNVLVSSGFKVNDERVVKQTDDDEGALTLVMSELPLYIDLYEDIEPDLLSIFDQINSINRSYLPTVPGVNLSKNLAEFEDFTKTYPKKSDQVIQFLEYVPDLIGSDEPANYLLILQNETEMRSSGGLLTAFGSMTLENGEFDESIQLEDTWNLELYLNSIGVSTGNVNIYGQLAMMLDGCGAVSMRAQDSGIYPDLNWTMNKFAEYYDLARFYNPNDYPEYDHILIINNAFAENLLNLIQPLEVEGFGEVTAENFFDLIKTETDRSDLVFDPERKAIVGDIANVAKERFSELPITEFPKVLDLFVDSVYARDLAIASTNEDIQEYLDRYALSGRMFQEFEGDYFHLNEAQNCSLKLNKWVRNTVNHNININDDGSIQKNISVDWEQPKIYEPGLDAQYSQSISFSYRAWVRLFTPADVLDENIYVNEFESNGLLASGYLGYFPVEYFDEVSNKAVSDNIIQFDHRRFSEDDPIPTQNLTVNYRLPDSLNFIANGESYDLFLQKHPGKSWGEKHTFNINYKGQTYTTDLTLDQDKVLTFNVDANGIGSFSISDYENRLDWLPELIEGIPFEELENEE